MTPIVIDNRPRCDVCGHVVHVQSMGEGTQYYEPDIDDCRERVAMLDELAPAAPAAPALDPERLAKALAIAEINCWANPVRHEAMDADEDRQHRLDAEALIRAYARLANPEKP